MSKMAPTWHRIAQPTQIHGYSYGASRVRAKLPILDLDGGDVTDGKIDQSENSKTEVELYRELVQQLEARLQGLEDRLGQDARSC